MTRWALIASGILFTGVGIIGIFLPLIPTTPFLLLAAACFARSSKRFHRWLLSNRWFGNYIKNYREGRGVPLRAKAISLCILWTTIIFSILLVPIFLVGIILTLVAIGVTIHILTIRTLK